MPPLTFSLRLGTGWWLPTLSALGALGLLSAAPRGALAQFNTNLLVNGDAESGPGDPNGNPVSSIPGFTVTGNATVIPYGAGSGFPSMTDPGPANRGAQFFAGGNTAAPSSLSQTVSLNFASSVIDAGNATFNLSSYLGGFSNQNDNAMLTISFSSASSQMVGTSTTLGPVLAADRNNVTGLLFRQASGTVPVGARSATAVLTFTRTDGSYTDGYADNLSFSVAPTDTPEPGTLSLVGMGLITGAGIMGTVRRRKAGKAKQAA